MGYVACILKKRNAYRVSLINPETKRKLVRPRHGWEILVKMDMKYMR